MTVRPWWMGRPLVWGWLLAASSCVPLSAPAQVAPLAVTLSAEAPCPVPTATTPLLRLPTGCPSPWAGVLYTPEEHARTREQGAQVNELAKARGKRADLAESRLLACRTQRDEVTAKCVSGVARLEGRMAALSTVTVEPVDDSGRGWVYALAGGLAGAAGSLVGLAGTSKGEAQAYSALGALAGAAVGVAVVWLVE